MNCTKISENNILCCNNNSICLEYIEISNCGDLNNISAFFISSFIVGTLLFIVTITLTFYWKLNERAPWKNRNNCCYWFKYYIIYIIIWLPVAYLIKFIVYSI